ARLLLFPDRAAARLQVRRFRREPAASRRRGPALQGEMALPDIAGRRARQADSYRSAARVGRDARLPRQKRVHRAARRALHRSSLVCGPVVGSGGADAARIAGRPCRGRRGDSRAPECPRDVRRPLRFAFPCGAAADPARRRARRGVSCVGMTAVFRLLRNVSSNYLRAGVDGLIIVVLTPFVVRTLGIELYAVWVIVQTLGYYLGFLDLGVADAQVQRHAVLQSQNRTDEIGRLHGTVLCFFVAAGVAAFLIAVVLAALPTAALFDVPAEAEQPYLAALVLAGAAMLLSFTSSAFDGIFEGYQRYDLMNAVDIVVSVAEAVAVCLVLAAGAGLVGLALVKVFSEGARAAAKLVAA